MGGKGIWYVLPFTEGAGRRTGDRPEFTYQRKVLRGCLPGTLFTWASDKRAALRSTPETKKSIWGYCSYAFIATLSYLNNWTGGFHIHRTRHLRNSYRTAGEPPKTPTDSKSNKLSCLLCRPPHSQLPTRDAQLVLSLNHQGHSCLPTWAHSPPLYQSKCNTLFSIQNKVSYFSVTPPLCRVHNTLSSQSSDSNLVMSLSNFCLRVVSVCTLFPQDQRALEHRGQNLFLLCFLHSTQQGSGGIIDCGLSPALFKKG